MCRNISLGQQIYTQWRWWNDNIDAHNTADANENWLSKDNTLSTQGEGPD